MMTKNLFEIFVYFLAVYGALVLSFGIVDSIRQKMNPENVGIKLILLVKNHEKTIEGIIRNIFIGDFLRKVMSDQKLLVVDMGSTDRTADILIRLQKEYSRMEVLNEDEKEMIFTYTGEE